MTYQRTKEILPNGNRVPIALGSGWVELPVLAMDFTSMCLSVSYRRELVVNDGSCSDKQSQYLVSRVKSLLLYFDKPKCYAILRWRRHCPRKT